jgi:SOS-response transcriptional repressor LexA
MNKKTAAILSLLFFAAVSCFSQNVIEERYMKAAKEQLEKKDYAKSFNYINNVLNLYSEDSLPQNIEILSEEVYFKYLENIRDTRNVNGFKAVKTKLLEFPFLSS